MEHPLYPMYPEPPAHDVIRLFGIDPGTDTLGVAIVDVNIDTYEPTLVYGHTFKASKSIDLKSAYVEIRGAKDLRLQSHADELFTIFTMTKPLLIGAESPFLKSGRVQAFEALVECYAMLRAVTWEYSPSHVLRRIDPVSAKNYVGVSHKGTDKDDVRKAVLQLYKDRCADGVDIFSLDEHSIDAVAVCHCLLRKYLLDEYVEPTRKKKRPRLRKKKRGKKK